MNIFWLDSDLEENVKMYVNKHVVKQLLEYTQMLSTAYYYTGQSHLAPYKICHPNHPCTVWVRTNKANWNVLFQLALLLYREFQYRYGGTHKSGEVLLTMTTPDLPEGEFTRPPECMPEDSKRDTVIESYRCYYRMYKTHLVEYKRRNIPDWLK